MPETFVEQNLYLRAVLDAIPSLVFIVDSNLKIMDVNNAARTLLGEDPNLILRRLCGDVLHCIHEVQSGRVCGQTEFCQDCVIRLAITTSSTTKSFHRQKYKMIDRVNGIDREADYFVTASPVIYDGNTLFLLVMEDVSELLALRHLATLCSYCSNVKNEEGEWEKVHNYLARKENLIFSHGMCPSCFEEANLHFKE